MGDPTVLLTVYGLALAPLGVGALSLPLRRALARRPLSRAQQELGLACTEWGWPEPRRWERRTIARGRLARCPVEVAVGPDPRHEGAGASLQTVWIRVRVDLGALGLAPSPVLLEPYRGGTVRGDGAWGTVWLGLGFEALAAPNDQVEVRAGSLTFDRFAATVRRGTLRRLVESVVATVQRAELHAGRLEAHLRALAIDHPRGAVRARSLRALAARPSGRTAAHDVARAALRDPDPRVRLGAASLLGREAEAVLWEFVTGAGHDEDHQLRALEALVDIRSPRRAAASRHLMKHPSTRVATAAMDVAPPEALAAVVEDPAQPALHRAAALEALERYAPEQARARARHALGAGPHALRVAAVDVLGRAGAAEDLAVVRRAGARAPAGSDLFIASRAALDLLRDRTRAEAGRVSLLHGDPEPLGAVSLPGRRRETAES
jgi:hypothetical protein